MPGKEEQKTQHEAVIKKAMDNVWLNEDTFVHAISCYYAFTNMGQDFTTRDTQGVRDGDEHRIFGWAYAQLRSEASSEGGPDIEPERRSWEKTAKKILKVMKKAKMDLTMANAEKVFNDPTSKIRV